MTAVLVCGLLVAGCSGGGDADRPGPGRTPSTPAPSKTTSPVATPSPSPSRGTTKAPTTPLRVKKGMTRPGARLRFGQKAIVPIRDFNGLTKTYTEGVLGIVVHPIKRLPGSEVDGTFDDESRKVLARHTAYYAKVVLTNEGGIASPGGPVDDLFDASSSGGDPPSVTVMGGEVSQCPATSIPPAFDRKGASFASCILAVSSPSEPIREIGWDQPPYGKEFPKAHAVPPRFNRYYELGPITWR